LLKKVSLANGKILYEHNKKSISPKHDHILCEDCGEIFEFFDHNITVLENEIAKKLNMKVTQRTHQLSGVCNSQNCSHLTN
jgi:Fe2+ or Zn2+ uptake regulation protein